VELFFVLAHLAITSLWMYNFCYS